MKTSNKYHVKSLPNVSKDKMAKLQFYDNNSFSKFKMAAARFIQNICVNFYSKQLKTIGVIGKPNACTCINVKI